MEGGDYLIKTRKGLTLNGRMECPKFAFIFYSYFKDEFNKFS